MPITIVRPPREMEPSTGPEQVALVWPIGKSVSLHDSHPMERETRTYALVSLILGVGVDEHGGHSSEHARAAQAQTHLAAGHLMLFVATTCDPAKRVAIHNDTRQTVIVYEYGRNVSDFRDCMAPGDTLHAVWIWPIVR